MVTTAPGQCCCGHLEGMRTSIYTQSTSGGAARRPCAPSRNRTLHHTPCRSVHIRVVGTHSDGAVTASPRAGGGSCADGHPLCRCGRFASHGCQLGACAHVHQRRLRATRVDGGGEHWPDNVRVVRTSFGRVGCVGHGHPNAVAGGVLLHTARASCQFSPPTSVTHPLWPYAASAGWCIVDNACEPGRSSGSMNGRCTVEAGTWAQSVTGCQQLCPAGGCSNPCTHLTTCDACTAAAECGA